MLRSNRLPTIRHQFQRSIIVQTLVLFSGLLAPWTAQAEWPQWRGPERTGVVKGPEWPSKLTGLNRLWRTELGPGYSGPILAEKLVIVAETENQRNEVVRGLDRRTGKEVWRQSWPGAMSVPFFAKANGDWIRATPAYDGESIYVAGMRDKVVCLDATTGSKRWERDFPAELKTPLEAFGLVCSPLVTDDSLYIQLGGGFFRLNKRTGEVVWRTLEDKGGMFGGAFSSPVMATIEGREQLIVQTRTRLTGVEPASGAVLWGVDVPNFRGMNILTPTVHEGTVFTSGYQRNSWLFTIAEQGGQWKVSQAWDNKLKGYMSSPVLIDGHVYMHLQNQRLACVEMKTGAIAWITSRRFGQYWSMVSRPPRILGLDQTGSLYLVEATPAEFRLLDERKVSDEETWGHLAISGREIVIRELHAVSAWRWDD